MPPKSHEGIDTLRRRIHTLTLVLSIVRPQAVPVSASLRDTVDNKYLRRLDRLSLFFVSSARGDVAAVSTTITPDTIELLQSGKFEDEDSEDEDSRVKDGQDARDTGSDDPEKNFVSLDLPNPVKDRKERSSPEAHDWLQAFWRSNSPSPRSHARLLEHLLSLRSPQDHQSLRHYVLFYCVRKIHGRLTMKYDTKNKLLDTILDISPTQVTEAFKAEIDGETPDRIQKQDEMWLVQLPGCNTLERDPPNGAERQTLKRSAANESLLWSSLTCLLRAIFKATTKLVGFRERHQPQQEDDINRTLTILNSALKSLARLLSRSGSIRRLLRNPAIANAIKERHTNPELDITPSDHEDVEDPGEIDSYPHQDIVRGWLQLLTPWTRALRDIETGDMGKLLHDRRLVIQLVREGPVPVDLEPLEDLLRSLEKGPPEPLLKTLKKSASGSASYHRNFITHPPASHEHNIAIENLSPVAHCGCQLASHADLQPEVIGVSTRCCFTCDLYLEQRGIIHSGSHGKVVPWFPPKSTDLKTLHYIFEQLRQQLNAFFREEKARRRLSRYSAAGASRSASSEPDNEVDYDWFTL